MFDDLEIIRKLALCGLDETEKVILEREFESLYDEEKQNFLLIMKNLKATYIIQNVNVNEDKKGKLVGFTFEEPPYLTGIGEKYLNVKTSVDRIKD